MVEDTGFRGTFRKSWEGVTFLNAPCGNCESLTQHSFEVYSKADETVPEIETKCQRCGASVYDNVPLISLPKGHFEGGRLKKLGVRLNEEKEKEFQEKIVKQYLGLTKK